MMSLLTLSSAQLMPGFAADIPSPSWSTKTPMPTARGQAAIITGDDGLIYVMGGYNGSVLSVVEAYNPSTDTWTTKTAMSEATRGAAVAKDSDGIIYVISGTNLSGYTNTVQAYNSTSDTWSTKTPIPTAAWMAGAATGKDGKIYVIGGESSGFFFSKKTQIYDPSTDTWSSGTDMPTGRSELRVVKGPDGLIYAMGGYAGSALSVVEAYYPSANLWITKTSMPSPKLEFGLVLGPDKKIYAIGGGTNYGNNAGPFYDVVEIYDANTDTWTIPGWPESALPTARKEFSAALGNNDRIYAIGGANGTYINTNEEASIVLPNTAPTAYIDSITPNPATRGETITFEGHGSDSDGSVKAYKWRSSISGTIGTAATVSTSTLTNGTHTIYFSVKDDSDAWSEEAMAIVTVNRPITEDPLYQELLGLSETMNEQVDDLADNVDALSQQNANLTDQVNNLTQKIDLMTLELLGASVVIIVLVVATIAVTYMSKRQSPPRTRRSPSA
jgi:N-acetylneuraminic acid mutarotase